MRKRERKILDLLAPESERVLAEYRERPLEFFGEYGRLWPEVIERIFWDIYMLRVDRACLVGPRGGGKTMGVSSLGTALYLWAEFDVLFLGGSKTQAQKGYAYAAEILHGDRGWRISMSRS